ncbi:nucleosome assembly protein (NAP) domain-containing protein [Ditylenchus destructor]|nr:nucleosome assembly protein (NAP) domain-containing protein [Ditylenchus destructor]
MIFRQRPRTCFRPAGFEYEVRFGIGYTVVPFSGTVSKTGRRHKLVLRVYGVMPNLTSDWKPAGLKPKNHIGKGEKIIFSFVQISKLCLLLLQIFLLLFQAKMAASGDHKHITDGDGEDIDVPLYSRNITELSRPVLRRVRAMKKNQLEIIDVNAKFNQRMHELVKEFEPLFNTAYQKRKAVIVGEHEPKDSECDVPLIHGIDQEELKLEESAPAEVSPVKGVPHFWLQAMCNTLTLATMIGDQDAEVLKHLNDVTWQAHVNPNGFTLFFHFDENPFFADRVLKKEYEIQITPDPEDPFDYDGPVVTKCKGMPIQWYTGKDVTKIELPFDSFFKFFDEKSKQATDDGDDPENEEIIDDFTIGMFIRDELIPRAVLYFTGEKDDEDDFGGSDDDESEDKNEEAKGEKMEE